MMVDTQDTRIMKEEEDTKIIDAICSFYKFNVESFCNSKDVASNIFLKTIKNNSFVTVYQFNCLGSFCLFDSINDLVTFILKCANRFEVHEDYGKRIVYINNVFLGCKTLEDVLIMKDLHSNEELEL